MIKRFNNEDAPPINRLIMMMQQSLTTRLAHSHNSCPKEKLAGLLEIFTTTRLNESKNLIAMHSTPSSAAPFAKQKNVLPAYLPLAAV